VNSGQSPQHTKAQPLEFIPEDTQPTDWDEIDRTIRFLITPGTTAEARMLQTAFHRTVSGYFDDHSKLVEAVYRGAMKYNPRGIFFTLNPVDPILLARANNRLEEHARFTTADNNILRRISLLIDTDAVRPAGISSTNEEHGMAIERARQIARDRATEWGDALIADSGNGGHLIYPIDLANDPASLKLMTEVLARLARDYSDDHVVIDGACSNAARLCKLYGTVARKGDPTPDRPHRMCRILSLPGNWQPISITCLEDFVRVAKNSNSHRNARPAKTGLPEFDMERYLARQGWPFRCKPWTSQVGGWIYELDRCPFNEEHRHGSAACTLLDGQPGFHCHHNGCSGRNIQDLFREFPPQPSQSPGAQKRQDEWPELIPFTQHQPDPIPSNSLPGWAGEMAHAVARNTETPFDLAGCLTLGVTSSCIAGKVLVSPESGYLEPTNLYVCPTGDPGTRRTGVFNALLDPFVEWENRHALLLEPEQKRKARERKILEQQIEKLSKKAADAKDPKKEFEKIHQLEQTLPLVPSTPQLFCEDCTPEALAWLMKENGERMAVFSDEGGPFDVLTGIRYSGNSGGAPNLDLILKAHSGSPVRVNRADRARSPIRLNSPCLTIAVTPQPDVLQSLKDKPGFRGRGLLARFLYALPPSLLGYRAGKCPPIPEQTRHTYEREIQTLLNWAPERPLVLRFSPAAYDIWKDFQKMVEQHFLEGGLLFDLKDWGGKLPGAAARIAGVLHAMTPEFAERRSAEILEPTALLAVELATSYIFHARAAFSLMQRDSEIEHAQKIANWFVERKLTSFGIRECFRAHQSRFERVDAMDQAIKLLIAHGYIRRTKQDSTGGRPPSDRCDVNPALFDQKENG
jgi:hypothetical protein